MLNRGFIYKCLDYKETSKIIYAYTLEGPISFKALSVNKKNSPLSSVLITSNIIEYEITSGDFPTLTNANIYYSFMDKLSDINLVEAIRIIIELVNILPNDINHIKTYEFIEKTLLNLSSNPKKVLSIFLIKMLYSFGINPNFKECLKCGKKENLIEISPSFGGALCNTCGSINNYNIWSEYYYKKLPFNEYSDYNYDELLYQINEFYIKNLGIDLKIK